MQYTLNTLTQGMSRLSQTRQQAVAAAASQEHGGGARRRAARVSCSAVAHCTVVPRLNATGVGAPIIAGCVRVVAGLATEATPVATEGGPRRDGRARTTVKDAGAA